MDNGHWYNEQSPIVSVLCYTAKIHVGLSDRDGQGGVQSVLDPNLCPARTGTAGRYKNANITQFGIAINSGIGLFSGQRVSIPDANHLLVSRHFYIPDVNAQEKD